MPSLLYNKILAILTPAVAEFGLAQPQLVLFKFLRPAHLDEFNLAAYQTENTHEGIRWSYCATYRLNAE